MSGHTHIHTSLKPQLWFSEGTTCLCWSADPCTVPVCSVLKTNMRERIYSLFLPACTELAQLHKIDFLPVLKYEKPSTWKFQPVILLTRVTLNLKFYRWMNGWTDSYLWSVLMSVNKNKKARAQSSPLKETRGSRNKVQVYEHAAAATDMELLVAYS